MEYTEEQKREALEHADWLAKYAKDHGATEMLGALAFFLRKSEAENAALREAFMAAMKKAGVQGLMRAKVFAALTGEKI